MRTGPFILAIAIVGCGGGVKDSDLVGYTLHFTK
jgi:hypothetical protein